MATTQDLGLLTRKLGAADYDPSRYVSEISQRCVGGEEVLAQRKVIQGLSDDTNNQLKKNVYQNYSQFIETAKEISHVESDMFRLSHMITEQRKMLTGLLETSLLGDRVPLTHTTVEAEGKEEEAEEVMPKPNQGRQELLDLMEKVEGGREVIQVQGRFVLYHGDLVEMDVSDNSALHRVHGYLCNDALVLATWLREKRGPVRFQLSSVAPLASLAMVNVRDLAGVKHAWKLLVPPDPRLFQCRDDESKKAWLAAYDEAKALQKTGGQPQPGTFTRMESLRPKRKHADVANPFGEEDDDEEEVVAAAEVELPEWLVELGDSLDVHIAQREFEQAVELLGEAGRELGATASCAAVEEARAVVASRKAALTQVLRGELTVTPEKSLQGGPRTARRAVALLCSLDRSREARDLLLAHRTAVLRHTVRNVRPEGSTVVYVQRLAAAFFQQTAEAAREFDKCFPGQQAWCSALLMWAEEEVEWFAERLDKQVFNSQSAVAVVAACVAFLRKQAERLVAQGLDLLFMLDARLQASVEKVVMEARDKAVEAIKLRWAEERWEEHECSGRQGLEKALAELTAAGVAGSSGYVVEETCRLNLTSNTLSFSLAYLHLADHLLQLFSPGTRHLVNESLVSVLHSHLRHLEAAVRSQEPPPPPAMVAAQAAFILDSVLPLAELRYSERTQVECPKLAKLHSNYCWLKEGSRGASVAKYSDPNYV